MREWRICEGLDAAAPKVRAIYESLKEGIERGPRPFPKIIAIALSNGAQEDQHDTVITPEICGGMDAVLSFGIIDRFAGSHAPDAQEIEPIVESVLESIANYRRHGVKKLARELDRLRRDFRVLCAQHREQGIHAIVTRLSLWRVDDPHLGYKFSVRATVSAIDAQLRPAEIFVDAFEPRALPRAFRSCLETLGPRYRALQEASARGASGFISKLAVNSLAVFDFRPEDAVRASSIDELDLDIRLTLHPYAGEITCWATDPSDIAVHWSEDKISLAGYTLPDSVLVSMVGKPITDVIDHPVLSSDMIVTATYNDASDWPGQALVVEFKAPSQLYCAETGRIWPAPHAHVSRS